MHVLNQADYRSSFVLPSVLCNLYKVQSHCYLRFCLFQTAEASKIIMQYVAAVSGKGKQVDKVKEQLLQCNPILEGKKILYL